MRRLARLVDLGNAYHTVLKSAQTFTQPFAQFRQLFATKQHQQYHGNYNQMCRLK